MFATAQSYSIHPQSEYFSDTNSSRSSSSSSISSNLWYPSYDPDFSGTETASFPEAATTFYSPSSVIKQEPFSPNSVIKQEPFSDPETIYEDELIQPDIVLGQQQYAGPYPYDHFELKELIPDHFFSSQQVTFPSTDVNRVVERQTFPNGLSCGTDTTPTTTTTTATDCSSAGSISSPHVVVTGQIDASNLERSEKDVKINPEEEHPKRKQKVAKPVKVSSGVLGSYSFPPDIELPAILGGKLPPRVSKASSKNHVFTEKELKRRQKKGLSDDSDSESEERRKVRLPHRSLLAITTVQMTQFVNFLKMNFDLSPSQLDELSRQKRLVKNRESACRFRAKNFLSLVEYRERVTELESDIVSLRKENERLRKALSEATESIVIPQSNLQGCPQ